MMNWDKPVTAARTTQHHQHQRKQQKQQQQLPTPNSAPEPHESKTKKGVFNLQQSSQSQNVYTRTRTIRAYDICINEVCFCGRRVFGRPQERLTDGHDGMTACRPIAHCCYFFAFCSDLQRFALRLLLSSSLLFKSSMRATLLQSRDDCFMFVVCMRDAKLRVAAQSWPMCIYCAHAEWICRFRAYLREVLFALLQGAIIIDWIRSDPRLRDQISFRYANTGSTNWFVGFGCCEYKRFIRTRIPK